MARELTVDDVEIVLICEPCQESIEGNCSAVNDVQDRKTARWIRRELSRGNDWAWCAVLVKAVWEGFEGTASVGCCSYRSAESFKADYYSEMVDEAMADLNAQVADARKVLAQLD